MLQKIERYMQTLSRVHCEISSCQYYPQDDFYRDCLIYEIQLALGFAWEFIEDDLNIQNSTAVINTAEAVLQNAVTAGIIQDAAAWRKAVSDWTVASPVYDKKTTEELLEQISHGCLPLLQAVGNRLADSLTMEDYLQLPAPIMLEVIKTDSKFNFRTNPKASTAFSQQVKKEAIAKEELRKKQMIAEFGYYDPDFHIDLLPRHRPKIREP